MTPRLKISVCTFQGGDFDVMLIDKETGEEVCFSGNQKITDEQLDIVNRLAPACVWTTYYPSEQYKALQARCDELLKVAEAAKDLPHLYDQAAADPYDVGYSQVSDEIELLRKALEELNDD